MALLILVAVCWSLTSGPEEGAAAGSTAVEVATDGGVDRGCEAGVGAGVGMGPAAVAAALASALADSDTLVSIPSKLCILHHSNVQGCLGFLCILAKPLTKSGGEERTRGRLLLVRE